MPNEQDRQIWGSIFAKVPDDWRTAPPSRATEACTAWLLANGVRSVLDVGCGIGRWAVEFARAGLDVAALDFAPGGVEYARRWAAEEGLRIRFVCAAATDLAFADERFDSVVAALVLDNLPRAEMPTALARMRDALHPGGLAFCLFNPVAVCGDDAVDNPTAGITRVSYSDEELRNALADWHIVRLERFDAGTRGYFLRSGSDHP